MAYLTQSFQPATTPSLNIINAPLTPPAGQGGQWYVDKGVEAQIITKARASGRPIPDVAKEMGYLNWMRQEDGGIGGYPGGPADPGNQGGGGQSLASVTQSEIDQANEANDARYGQELDLNAAGKQEQLGALNQSYMKMLGLVGPDQAALAQLDRDTKNAQGKALSDAQARGLGNTSIVSNMQRGVAEDANIQRLRIEQAGKQQQLGVEQSYLGQLLDSIRQSNDQRVSIVDRRTDQGPDLGLLANVLGQAGSTGASNYLGLFAGSKRSQLPSATAPANAPAGVAPVGGGGSRPALPTFGRPTKTLPVTLPTGRPPAKRSLVGLNAIPSYLTRR